MILTPTETVLLNALRNGRRVTTERLIQTVWPDRRRHPLDPYGTIRVHAHNLRRKLPRSLCLLGNFGEGYQLALSRTPAGSPEAVKSAASAKPSCFDKLDPATANLPVAGTFSISEDLLMHPPARAGASENTRPSSRPIIAAMPSMSAPASPI